MLVEALADRTPAALMVRDVVIDCGGIDPERRRLKGTGGGR
jgi:hypothetical protein